MKDLDHLLKIFYKCISGANNQERDWSTHALLFVPDARLYIITNDKGARSIECKTPAEYAAFFRTFIGDHAFYEEETQHRIEFMDSFAVVWSDYISKIKPDGQVIYSGTNCLNIFNNGSQWQIVSVTWERKVQPSLLGKS